MEKQSCREAVWDACGANSVGLRAWGLPFHWRIPTSSEAIRVHSAFGGLGFYSMRSIDQCWYNQTGVDCEHVSFHKCARVRNKANVAILPNLVNSGGDREVKETENLIASITVCVVLVVVVAHRFVAFRLEEKLPRLTI